MKITREFVRDGKPVAVTAEPLGDGGVRMASLDAAAPRAFVAFGAPAGKAFMVRVDGRTHTLEAPSSRRAGGASGADGTVRAPMTGTVLDVACKVGDVVAADQTLVVVSAMKMEHKLAAGIAGTVRKVGAQKGATVEQGAELVVVEPAAAVGPA